MKIWCIVLLFTNCSGFTGRNDKSLIVGGDSIKFLLQKGISQIDSIDNDSASLYLERALQLAMHKSPGKNVMFDIYYNLGIQSEKSGNNDLAVSYFNEAVKFSSKKNLANIGNAYNHLGRLSEDQGSYDEALVFFHEALDIRKQLHDVEGQASSYRNIGTAYQRNESYEQAQEQYELSLKLYSSLNNEMGKADCYNNLGGLWLKQSKPQKALEYYHECEKIYSTSGTNEQLWTIYRNIGEIYYLMYETEQAKKYYSKMMNVSRSISSPRIIAETYLTVGAFLDENQKQDSALFCYNKAIEIANSAKLYEVLQYALEQRSWLYAGKGRYKDAYTDLMAYNYAYNEVNNKENVKAFTQKSEHYKFELQQMQQRLQNRIQRIFIITLSAIVLLVCAMIIVQYRAFIQKKKDHELLEEQHNLLQKQEEEITDSIRYASLIQRATLPAKEYTDRILPEHFIHYKPRDIVSGDFYWINKQDDYIIVAAADCTGHGVPGAIVSMLGISTLAKIAGRMKIPQADQILNELREEIIHLLNPVGHEETRKDGMDIALVIIDTIKREIEFSGAYNPLYLIRDKELIEKKANRMPVGIYAQKEDEPFTSTRFEYFPADTFYVFSDGYADQFGGQDGSKLKSKNFKNLLLEINKFNMEEQGRLLEIKHIEWRGEIDQIDDVLVVGVRL